MKTACDLLTQMDEEVLVKKDDWIQGRYATDWVHFDGAKCLVGALNFCATGNPRIPPYGFDPQRHAYEDAFDAITHAAGEDVFSFNDSPVTKFADVKRVIRQARKAVC